MKKTIAFLLILAAKCVFAAENVIWDNAPGKDWQSSWYPLGNGRLGCMVDGGVQKLRIQFNVDSLWTGDKNLTKDIHDNRADANYATMGKYQNFGELEISFEGLPQAAPSGYRRSLNLSRAVYADGFSVGAYCVKRRIFASAPDDAVFIVIREEGEKAIKRLTLKGAHAEGSFSTDANRRAVSFSGRLSNALKYAARAEIISRANERDTVIVLRAVTGTDELAGYRLSSPIEKIIKRHISDYRGYYDRMTLDLGEGDRSVPTRERLQRVKNGADDVALIALMFNFGRYLLISSSRPGTLPANLQGIWNNSNDPMWHSDYHTNINIQMNYWGADSANLSECFTALSDWMLMSMPTAAEGSRAAFPGSKGYAYRTSANAFGGGGWRWNFAGAPWMAAQCYDHWLFTRDRKFLENVCWPLMKGAAEFILSTQLKERADGTIVVKDGWSPEHGPREDGVAHDQQIMRELFRCIIAAAKELGVNDSFVKEVARVEPKLLKDKIGSWGQLQEWESDRDVKGCQHRHTSHLYAVYPGSTISRKATPQLAKAARTALEGRTTTGDSRRSWTWPWRAALWARLGDGDKAGEMLHSLLRYNTLDNMFATHPPCQIDGNLGMVGAVCEMLLEKSIPSDWKGGSVKGLKTREGKTLSFEFNRDDKERDE